MVAEVQLKFLLPPALLEMNRIVHLRPGCKLMTFFARLEHGGEFELGRVQTRGPWRWRGWEDGNDDPGLFMNPLWPFELC